MDSNEQWTFPEVLDRQAARWGDRPFLRFDDKVYTFAEMAKRSHTFAAGLEKAGVKAGDHVAVMLPNCIEYVEAWFGILRLGAVYVPINILHRNEMLAYFIGHSDSMTLVTNAELFPHVERILPSLPNLRQVFVRGPLPVGISIPVRDFEDLRIEGGTYTVPTIHPWTLGAIKYTSGTTGPSKGVMGCHHHIFHKAATSVKMMGIKSDDIVYDPLPLYHGQSSHRGVIACLLAGAQIAVVEKFSVSKFWPDVIRFNATIAVGVHSMVPMLKAADLSELDRKHRVRAMYAARADDEFTARFGVALLDAYGQTETDAPLHVPYGEQKPGSVGREAPEYIVRIVDDHDREVPDGEVGEIVVRPRHPWAIMMGYYKMPEATIATWRNLWYHTGDYGSRDADGYYYYVDRKKDAIRRRGENISSFEIERVLNLHPKILETAAIAVPSDVLEDEVKVCIVLKDGESLTHQEVIDFCVDKMAGFMVPRYVEFLDQQFDRRTPTLRIEKNALRQEGNRGLTPATWDRLRAEAAE